MTSRDRDMNLRRVCALLAAGVEGSEAVTSVCRKVDDWASIVATARAHDVLPVVNHYARSAGVVLPGALDDTIRRECFVSQARMRAVQPELYRILGALDNASIPAVALKGPVLAERLYAEPTTRVSADLDVLIAADRIEDAMRCLQPAGFTLAETEAAERFLRASHYQLILLKEGLDQMLELHFRAIRAFGVVVDAGPLLDRSRRFTTSSGTVVSVLSTEDELLYLAIHAAKHFALRAKWYFDIALFLRARPELDLTAVFERARSLGVERGLAYALRTTAEYFGPISTAASDDVVGPRRLAAVRALSRRADRVGAISSILAVVHGAVLADHTGTAVATLGAGMSRMGKRRAHRYLKGLVPADWSA